MAGIDFEDALLLHGLGAEAALPLLGLFDEEEEEEGDLDAHVQRDQVAPPSEEEHESEEEELDDVAQPFQLPVMGDLFLQNFSDTQCKDYFRFSREHIILLVNTLNMPQFFKTKIRVKVSATEGLCIVLRRFAYPNRLSDLVEIFGCSVSAISSIVDTVVDHLFVNYHVLVQTFDHPWLVNNLQLFADQIHAKGSPLTDCWGFIDGTVRPICRPVVDQQASYNGHKRTHALKYQIITTPNGLIANLSGPFEGNRHDGFLFRESGVENEIQHYRGARGQRMYLYGDSAYALKPCMMTPFSSVNITPDKTEFNKNMSKVRQCVEWSIGKTINLFAFLDFKKNQKLLLQPVGKYYVVATLLCNFHTCVYGSQTGRYFQLAPPTLANYIQIAH
jgi:hypothetical protein